MANPIGDFESAAIRRRAWLKLYRAAELYRLACEKLHRETRKGWTAPGSEVDFKRAYTKLEEGINYYRRSQELPRCKTT